MKLTTLVVLASAVAITGCSKGSDNKPARNTPRGLSASIQGEVDAPQQPNTKAVAYISALVKRSDNAFPQPEVVLKGDTNAQSYKDLDEVGRKWFDKVRTNCDISNPPPLNQESQGTHSRAESISGSDCPISYQGFQLMSSQMEDKSDVMAGSATMSMRQDMRVVDPNMQSETGLQRQTINLEMAMKMDAGKNNGEIQDIAVHAAGTGKFAVETREGNISADFKFEMAMNASSGGSNVQMAAVGTVHTPAGDVAMSFKMKNEKMEIKVGGQVMSPEDFTKIFGSGLPQPLATAE